MSNVYPLNNDRSPPANTSVFLDPLNVPHPLHGQQLSSAYMSMLYEALMDSIGVTGTMKNLRHNYDLLSQIVKKDYDKNPGLRMLNNNFKEDRRVLFAPIFEKCWSKEGL